METLSHLVQGFQVALAPANLGIALVGVVLGLIIGILPGLGGTSGVAILLPLTVFVASTSGIIFLASIYWGALFGGVITSILFNIPGEPWSVALLFDGYPLARQGWAGLALTAAFIASIFGVLIAIVIFTFLMLPLAEFSLKFGPPELFAVMLMAFATFVGLGGSSPLKTLAMLALGLLLAMVGLDVVTGMPRFTFGTLTLLSGFHFVPLTIGLYGLGEILASAEEGVAKLEGLAGQVGFRDVREALHELWSRFPTLLSSTILGFWVGILPGTGATPASFLGYGIARQYSRRRDAFGTGTVEGIIAPQTAAQAAGIGALLANADPRYSGVTHGSCAPWGSLYLGTLAWTAALRGDARLCLGSGRQYVRGESYGLDHLSTGSATTHGHYADPICHSYPVYRDY